MEKKMENEMEQDIQSIPGSGFRVRCLGIRVRVLGICGLWIRV